MKKTVLCALFALGMMSFTNSDESKSKVVNAKPDEDACYELALNTLHAIQSITAQEMDSNTQHAIHGIFYDNCMGYNK